MSIVYTLNNTYICKIYTHDLYTLYLTYKLLTLRVYVYITGTCIQYLLTRDLMEEILSAIYKKICTLFVTLLRLGCSIHINVIMYMYIYQEFLL